MERIRRSLSKLPAWLFSIVVMLAILWLTLAPEPLGDEMPPMFPGADKIAHAIMFGGLSVVMMLDWQRKHAWEKVGAPLAVLCAFISSCLGALIEVAQSAMEMGRGFEYGDIIADTIGAFLFVWVYCLLQNHWIQGDR